MKKLLIILTLCIAFSCKKNTDKTLTNKNWKIESATVTPALTIGNKTSTNYIELMGGASCIANMLISFSVDGTYSAGSNGALCDMASTSNVKTWKRNGDQVILSGSENFPMLLKDNKLTQTVTTNPIGGIIYTYVYVYKAQSK